MTVKTQIIEFNSRGNADILDITPDVSQALGDAGLTLGTVTLFSPSATSALTTIEYESGCLSDIRRLFDDIVEPNRHYAHNARWGDGNGHSHVRSALLGPSLSVPFIDGGLTLGTWQQIIFIDFDNRARQRRLIAQFIGE